MKITPKNNPKCPRCSNLAIKIGFRKSKLRDTRRYLCKQCKTSFTHQPPHQIHKTYNLKAILTAISNYNLGQPLRKNHPIPSSTIHNWLNQLKQDLPFHRLRNKIKNLPKHEIIIKQRFIHHNQPFLYQYHNLKLQFAKKFPTLINYLKNLNQYLPKGIFENSQRISAVSKEIPTTRVKSECRGKFGYEVPNFPLRVGFSQRKTVFEPNVVVGISESNKKSTEKQNYAVKLANLALSITKNNKERHEIIENFMLINDTATIATEIPVYLEKEKLTGHIDILQARYHKLYILDYKPEPINKHQTINQLKLYRKALSNITKIKEHKFKLAFFNDKGYYEV